MKYSPRYGIELEELLCKASLDRKLFHNFLSDLLSPTEYKDLGIRWQIVKLLEQGIPQREIAQKLQVSVATVTRGSRELANKKGGFQKMLQKSNKKSSHR